MIHGIEGLSKGSNRGQLHLTGLEDKRLDDCLLLTDAIEFMKPWERWTFTVNQMLQVGRTAGSADLGSAQSSLW